MNISLINILNFLIRNNMLNTNLIFVFNVFFYLVINFVNSFLNFIVFIVDFNSSFLVAFDLMLQDNFYMDTEVYMEFSYLRIDFNALFRNGDVMYLMGSDGVVIAEPVVDKN